MKTLSLFLICLGIVCGMVYSQCTPGEGCTDSGNPCMPELPFGIR